MSIIDLYPVKIIESTDDMIDHFAVIKLLISTEKSISDHS